MSNLIPAHGGYRGLKSFQLAQLVYDVTVSKKIELKLTQVARASLEELRLDYEDFLRQRDFELWPHEHPCRMELVARRCQTADEVAAWVAEVSKRGDGDYPQLSANAALVLIGVACALLDRQVKRLAKDFETEGGFTERLYRMRQQYRKQ